MFDNTAGRRVTIQLGQDNHSLLIVVCLILNPLKAIEVTNSTHLQNQAVQNNIEHVGNSSLVLSPSPPSNLFLSYLFLIYPKNVLYLVEM